MNRTGLVSAAEMAHSVIRVGLSLAMIGFGMVKVIPTQFIVFTLPGEMVVSLGESSPSGMLWKFMATSTPYTVIAGTVEVIGGLLLIFRRTVLLGALVCMVALIQVSTFNIAYHVPVGRWTSFVATDSAGYGWRSMTALPRAAWFSFARTVS